MFNFIVPHSAFSHAKFLQDTLLFPPQLLQCHLLAEMEPCSCSFSSSGFVSRAYLKDLFIQTDLRTDHSLFLTDPQFQALLCTYSRNKIHFLSENTPGNRLLYLEKYSNRWQELFQGSAAHCITSLLHFSGGCVCVYVGGTVSLLLHLTFRKKFEVVTHWDAPASDFFSLFPGLLWKSICAVISRSF